MKVRRKRAGKVQVESHARVNSDSWTQGRQTWAGRSPGRDYNEPNPEPSAATRATNGLWPTAPVLRAATNCPVTQTGRDRHILGRLCSGQARHRRPVCAQPISNSMTTATAEESSDLDDELAAPRWPWVVSVARHNCPPLRSVVSVSLLVRTTTAQQARHRRRTTSCTARCGTKSRPPSRRRHRRHQHRHHRGPAATETQTVTGGAATHRPHRRQPTAPPPATTTTAAAPPPDHHADRSAAVAYSVTGTKAPGDIISVTYVGCRAPTDTANVYIPWS